MPFQIAKYAWNHLFQHFSFRLLFNLGWSEGFCISVIFFSCSICEMLYSRRMLMFRNQSAILCQASAKCCLYAFESGYIKTYAAGKYRLWMLALMELCNTSQELCAHTLWCDTWKCLPHHWPLMRRICLSWGGFPFQWASYADLQFLWLVWTTCCTNNGVGIDFEIQFYTYLSGLFPNSNSIYINQFINTGSPIYCRQSMIWLEKSVSSERLSLRWKSCGVTTCVSTTTVFHPLSLSSVSQFPLTSDLYGVVRGPISKQEPKHVPLSDPCIHWINSNYLQPSAMCESLYSHGRNCQNSNDTIFIMIPTVNNVWMLIPAAGSFSFGLWWHVSVRIDFEITNNIFVVGDNLGGVCYENVNSSSPGQNGRRFTDDIFRCIFPNKKICILVKISLKFVPKGPTDNNPVLVKIMVWGQIGEEPLSHQPVLTRFTDAFMRH